MMRNRNISHTIGFFLGMLLATQAGAISTNFIARGFQSCTKNCAIDKIKCLNNSAETAGSYAWCKSCDYEGKTNRQAIQDALKKCDAARKDAADKDAEALARVYRNEHSEDNAPKQSSKDSEFYRYAR
jgi:hypothetical protein